MQGKVSFWNMSKHDGNYTWQLSYNAKRIAQLKGSLGFMGLCESVMDQR